MHSKLRHIPYLSRSYSCWNMHTVIVEMLSHVLIGWGFITSLFDGIHVILGHIHYMLGSYGVCLFVHTVPIEMMSHKIFLGFIMFMLHVILGHIPWLARSSRFSWFVQIVLIKRMSLVMTFSFISSCFYWMPY